MKIRLKIILCILTVALVITGAVTAYVNTVVYSRVQAEKTQGYLSALEQLAASAYLVTREVEQSLFNQYSSTSLAAKIRAEPSVSRTLDLEGELRFMACNSPYYLSLAAIDLEGNTFYGTSVVTRQGFEMAELLRSRQAWLGESFTRWFRDEAGRLYLKKDVYTISPVQKVGMIAAQLETDALQAILGLERELDGALALLTGEGRLILEKGGMTQEQVDEMLAGSPLDHRPASLQIALPHGDYWLTRVASAQSAWQLVHLVPMAQMLQMPRGILRVSLLACGIALVLALVLALALTHPLTSGVKGLLLAMNRASQGNYDPVPVTSQDEIGQLAQRFNWLLGCLHCTTAEMIQRATEKQQAQYALLELKYRSLQAQISPHLICNILSCINALAIMGKTQEVSATSVKASRYLRDNLKHADQKYTTLQGELGFVTEYVALYRAIYAASFAFNTLIPPETLPLKVPNMILQPLVENALIHGGPMGEDQLQEVSVSAQLAGGQLCLQVSDNGQGISQEVIDEIFQTLPDQLMDKGRRGFGLRGVMQRLRLLYGDSQSMTIQSTPGCRCVITIRLPAA